MLLFAEALAALLVISTALPFLPLAHGIVRIGDFPRQQILVVAVLLLAASFVVADDELAWRIIQVSMLVVIVVQAAFIAPYTRLWRRETADDTGEPGHPLRLVASNVKMSNTRHADLARAIVEVDPDIVVLMEVDARWMEGLSPLLKTYPHLVDLSRDNSYGMALASRFPLEDVETEDLLTEGVPSIVCTVLLPDGQRFRLYSIHPEPPVPHRGSEGRDGETSLVALRARDDDLPVLVTGDLNDVAWSGTTRRFRRISRLLDPRIGREVFSTFDARYPLMRWPLDHLFHTSDFRLREMHRLDACGSDHFPVFFELVLCPTEHAESEPEQADGEDLERAGELVRDASRRDEKPIGTDWEK